MKTTVQIDDEIVPAVEDLARREGKTFNEMVAELARRGLTPRLVSDSTDEEEIPAFEVPESTETITLEMVKKALDDA